MNCRHCAADLDLTFVDLGTAPPSNAYLTAKELHAPEKWFPLRVMVCQACWLAQTEDFAQAHELFEADYAYFSGFSTSWLEHSERYAEDMVARFELTSQSHVVEIAANDGSLLQYFKDRDIPCTGIEPTQSTADAARAKGLDIIEDFFDVDLARSLASENRQADLMTANNVLAHVPDINSFVDGFALLLKPLGAVTFEFPHLLQLVNGNQFDTIYHEHFSYLSLTAVNSIFSANGLAIFDVEELPTHGGSLRVFAQRSDTGQQPRSPKVDSLISREAGAGMHTAAYYTGFQDQVEAIKYEFVAFLLDAKRAGKSVGAYGAAAKGNTLLNFCGVRPDLIPFVVDRNPAKQGKFMPGSRIPVVDELRLQEVKPNYVLILPWNLKDEIVAQLAYGRDWGVQFVTAIPEHSVF
jgi:SAM-dependent methyltransferase